MCIFLLDGEHSFLSSPNIKHNRLARSYSISDYLGGEIGIFSGGELMQGLFFLIEASPFFQTFFSFTSIRGNFSPLGFIFLQIFQIFF